MDRLSHYLRFAVKNAVNLITKLTIDIKYVEYKSGWLSPCENNLSRISVLLFFLPFFGIICFQAIEHGYRDSFFQPLLPYVEM